MTPQQRRTLDDVARDLDLLVYRLERQENRESPPDPPTVRSERAQLRKDLERLRDRLPDVVDDLW